jgi:hypothetical protein
LVHPKVETAEADLVHEGLVNIPAVIVDGHSICPPKLGRASVGGAVLIRPDGCVGFQTEKWNPEARSALDGFLNIQFSSAGTMHCHEGCSFFHWLPVCSFIRPKN